MGIFKFDHPFYLFVLSLPLFILGIIVFIFSVFTGIRLLTIIFDKINYRKLKHIIERNPHIGLEGKDANFIYKQGKFTLKYRVISLEINEAKKRIELIYAKKKLWPCEEKFIRFKKGISEFLIYHEWMHLFKLPVFSLLLISISIFYFVLVEPQIYKDYRLRWVVSHMLRIDIKNVEIKPGGWVKIWGSRRMAVDQQTESISYNVNLSEWFTHLDEGYITRWRGKQYGYVDHSLKYDDYGNIWLEKEGKWIAGKINKGALDWEEPQGTGIRAGKVLGHQLHLKDEFSSDDK